MRDAKRIDMILKSIKNIWKNFPDLRLGQLLCNCANYNTLYYIEDEELVNLLCTAYTNLLNKQNNKNK